MFIPTSSKFNPDELPHEHTTPAVHGSPNEVKNTPNVLHTALAMKVGIGTVVAKIAYMKQEKITIYLSADTWA
jgi:hypothetical protein